MTMGVPMAGTLSSRAMMLFGSFSGFVGVGGGRMIYLELSIGWKRTPPAWAACTLKI